jgi:hypothetical protein
MKAMTVVACFIGPRGRVMLTPSAAISLQAPSIDSALDTVVVKMDSIETATNQA